MQKIKKAIRIFLTPLAFMLSLMLLVFPLSPIFWCMVFSLPAAFCQWLANSDEAKESVKMFFGCITTPFVLTKRFIREGVLDFPE